MDSKCFSSDVDYVQLYLLGAKLDRSDVVLTFEDRSLVNLDEMLFEARSGIPFSLHRHMGRKYLDVMNTSDLHKVVSKRVRALLEKLGFTGWKLHPAVLDVRGERVTYYILETTGKAGALDKARREKVWQPPLADFPGSQGTWKWKGMYFANDEWDGSDFVTPQGTHCVIVTERVKEAFESAKLTGCIFTRCTDFEIYALPEDE